MLRVGGPHAAAEAQRRSLGISLDDITQAVLGEACPTPGLTWLDVGCGRGDIGRELLRAHAPGSVTGIDVIDFLADDLRGRVELLVGRAEEVIEGLEPSDRVLLVEVIEHLEAPWTVLRACAQRVAKGGRLVLSTPNIASLRNRLNLATRGQLSAFRADNLPHMTPALPHVAARILREEGLHVEPLAYAGADVLPLTGGRQWPAAASRRFAELSHVSVVISAERR